MARKIYTTFPNVAVLRRHPDPKMDLLDKMVEQLSFLGVRIDGKTKFDNFLTIWPLIFLDFTANSMISVTYYTKFNDPAFPTYFICTVHLAT